MAKIKVNVKQGDVTIETISVNVRAYIKGAPGTSSVSDYYDIGIINSNVYTFQGFTLPNLTMYTNKSINESLKVFADGIKYWYNDGDQDFSDQYIKSGNTLQFMDTVQRLEVEFINKLILK